MVHSAQPPRALDRGWRERHIRWQAEGMIPAGKTPLLYEDMTPVFDRRGVPRMWSQHVSVAMQPGQRSARTIAREKAKTAEAERVAAEAAKLRSQVHRSLKPLSGRLWSLHTDALLVVGPGGGIPIPASAVAVLEPLAAGGRHALPGRDRAALNALAPRLAAVGLKTDHRATGQRIARDRARTKELLGLQNTQT